MSATTPPLSTPARKPRALARAALPAPRSALSHDALFGAPPLIAGEDRAAYDGLTARVVDAVAPADVLEEMWVRDVVDLAWEALRMRRLKAALLTAAAPEGLTGLLTPVIGSGAARALADQWVAGGRRAARRVDALLAATGLGRGAVTARTLALHIDEIERIDRMTTLAEARRAAALQEIERHRAALAQGLRRALAAEDADDADAGAVVEEDAAPDPGSTTRRTRDH
jgi:hypothetical protein